MLRRLIGIGCTLAALVAVCVFAALSTTTRATSIPLPPGRTFTSPVVTMLRSDPDRPPAVPIVTDRTVLGTVPAGVGPRNIPSGTPRPIRTNAWWSAGTLNAWPAPLFPLPFKAVFSTDGLLLSVPGRRTDGKTIFHQDTDVLRIFTMSAPVSAMALTAGDFDVSFRVRSATTALYDATLIQGSPFVFLRPSVAALTIAIPTSAKTSTVSCGADCVSALLITSSNVSYLLVSPTRNAFTVNGSIVQVRIERDKAILTVAAVAPGSEPRDYLAAAMRPYTSTIATYSIGQSDVFSTFRFPQPTIMGILPHQYVSLAYTKDKDAPAPFIQGNPGRLIGTFDTVRGPLRLYSGRGFRTSVPRLSLLPSLPPLAALGIDASLHDTLRREIAENVPPAGDIYNAAKSLHRTAQLAELADALREGDLWKTAVQQAKTSLVQACTASPGPGMALYFAYDKTAGGILGLPQGFGSEHYNDHHFQYGYIIASAAIVARYDATFARQYGDCIRLLIRDIASPDRNDPSFPYLRYFDPYGGHSWANGLTPFADGTNQESESEALQAWYAIALYGHTTGSKALEDLGLWMYAQETQAAKVYWLNAVPDSGAFPADFDRPMISMLWSGKADYATWFSGEDDAIRSIQFFPVSAAILPFVTADTVLRIIAPTAHAGDVGIWKTGLTLIAGIFDPQMTVPAEWPVDPGYSRTFVDYWQKAFRILGQPVGPTGSCPGYVFQNGTVLNVAVYRFPGDPVICDFSVGKRSIKLTQLNVGWSMRGL